MIEVIKQWYKSFVEQRERKRRLKELRKRDPFIYK